MWGDRSPGVCTARLSDIAACAAECRVARTQLLDLDEPRLVAGLSGDVDDASEFGRRGALHFEVSDFAVAVLPYFALKGRDRTAQGEALGTWPLSELGV
jgi:hypothetical protein